MTSSRRSGPQRWWCSEEVTAGRGAPGGPRIQASYFALEGTDDLLETYEKIRARPNPDLQFLGVVITLHDRRTVLSRDIQRQIREVFGEKVFRTMISKSVRLEESPAYKQSIFAFAPNSSGANEYYSLSEEVMGRV